MMSRIRGKNTTPERYISALMQAAGIDFVQHDRSLPGCPDFVIRPEQLVVFVDGDFWHGWRFPEWQHKLSNQWQDKITNTRRRDRNNHRRLRRARWRVVRIWEHEVELDPIKCVQRIAASLGKVNIDWNEVKAAYERLPPVKRRPRLPKP